MAALIASMILSAILGHKHLLANVALAFQAIVWLIADASFEGPTLIDLGRGHGLVRADLVGLAAGLIAVVQALWLLLPHVRSRLRRLSPKPSSTADTSH